MSFGTAWFQFLGDVQLGSYSLFHICLCGSCVHLEDEICTDTPAHKTRQFNSWAHLPAKVVAMSPEVSDHTMNHRLHSMFSHNWLHDLFTKVAAYTYCWPYSYLKQEGMAISYTATVACHVICYATFPGQLWKNYYSTAGHLGTWTLIATGGSHDFVLVTSNSKSGPIMHHLPNTDYGNLHNFEMAAMDDACRVLTLPAGRVIHPVWRPLWWAQCATLKCQKANTIS